MNNSTDLRPAIAEVEVWAYDAEGLLWDCVDEDGLLCDVAYIPTLISAARDEECPKREYILGIMDNIVRQWLLNGGEKLVAEAARSIELIEAAGEPAWGDWVALLKTRLGHRTRPRPVNRSEALSIGRDLFLGRARIGNVSVMGKDFRHWVVEFSVPHGSHRERLLVSRSTGELQYRGMETMLDRVVWRRIWK